MRWRDEWQGSSRQPMLFVVTSSPRAARTVILRERGKGSKADGSRLMDDGLRPAGCGTMATLEDRLKDRIRNHLLESAEIKRQVADGCQDSILAAARLIADCFRAGGKLLLCGNGGSAADSQHVAAEFVSRLTGEFERPGLPAIALTTDTSFLTGFANDHEFDGVFERQVQALGRRGDVLMAISTSGRSRNVIRAVEAAATSGISSIALTGGGGRMAAMADVAITIPSSNTQFVQEAHLAVEHLICDLVERYLFGERGQAEEAAA